VSLPFYRRQRQWLSGDPARRLFFIENDPGRIAQLEREEDSLSFLNDPKVKIFACRHRIDQELIGRRIGAMAGFATVTVIGDSWGPFIQKHRQIAEMLLADGADFGVRALAHIRRNFLRPLRSFQALRDTKKGIPALVVGAGPSARTKIAPWKNKALIIAAGSGVELCDVAPHLAVALCPHRDRPYQAHLSAPRLIQGRVRPKSIRDVSGPLFWIPDSHFPFETEVTGVSPLLEGGWTVGNTAISAAHFLGCDPIVLLGMEHCIKPIRNGDRSDEFIAATDRNGKPVWTQRDWQFAAEWIEQFAAAHTETSFYTAYPGGLPLGDRIVERSLDVLDGPPRDDLALSAESAPLVQPSWNQLSLDSYFQSLWRLWEPIFERELMVDPQPLSMEAKLSLQKQLFCEQFYEEHGRAAIAD
jgi:hypothetical protein